MVVMCDLCQLAHGDEDQHLTDWYYLGLSGEVPEEFQGVVALDKDSKEYAARLLWVPCRHVRGGEETKEMRKAARIILAAVAQAVAVNRDLVLVGFDLNKLSIKDHWHAQALLNEPEETTVGLLR